MVALAIVLVELMQMVLLQLLVHVAPDIVLNIDDTESVLLAPFWFVD